MVNTENNFFNVFYFLSYLVYIVLFLGGVIGLLEDALQRPLHWVACMLHSNKLHLRHLLAKMNGKTVGPRGLSRPFGKLLAWCENLPIVKLEPVGDFNLDNEPSDPSTDQMYLYGVWLFCFW